MTKESHCLCQRCRRAEPANENDINELAEEYCAGSALRSSDVKAQWRKQYGVEGAIQLPQLTGCNRCSGIGYAGRLAIYELLVASPAIKRIAMRRGTADKLRTQAMTEGMRTLKQDGIDKVLKGLTTIDQVRAIST